MVMTMASILSLQHQKFAATKFIPLTKLSLARSLPCSLALVQGTPATRETRARFSTSRKTTSSGKASILGTSLLLLATLSDPFITALESRKEDVNVSYWKMNAKKQEPDSGHAATTKGCRLRNSPRKETSDTANDVNSLHSPPEYSRVVIVGGGMAGLHTALCLAERMHNPHSQEACPPKDNHGWRMSRNKFFSHRQEEELDAQIIVLEASEIGNGASGRAKGMVVPGFQVPLESLEKNAYDYEFKDTPDLPSIPVLIRTIKTSLGIHDTTPRYPKAVARELYDATYVALERLRDVVNKYNIDCDWVETGGVEASVFMSEEEEDGNDEEVGEERDYDCRILTSQQVDQLMGRQTVSSGTAKEADIKHSLYKRGEYNPNCAGVNPFGLTVGLADAIEGWGVKIYEYTKVAKLEKCNNTASQNAEGSARQSTYSSCKGKYKLSTKEGHVIHCDHVVLCTGAESGLSTRLSRSLVPIYTWMVATEPLYEKCPLTKDVADKVLSELSSRGQSSTKQTTSSSPHAAPMCGDDHFALNYWRNNNNNEGRLLFGSLCDSFSFPPMFISWRLRNALTEVYPHLSNVRFDHVWGGKLAVALNSMPIVGRDVDYDDDIERERRDMSSASKYITEGGVWYNTGFAGHGIVPTALAGSVIANAILGIPDRLTLNNAINTERINGMHHEQLWHLFHTYFPPSSWNGYPYSRAGSCATFLLYNLFDWLEKKGLPVPRLPEIW